MVMAGLEPMAVFLFPFLVLELQLVRLYTAISGLSVSVPTAKQSVAAPLGYIPSSLILRQGLSKVS